MTSSEYVPLAENEDQCDGCGMICIKSQADFVSHDGDQLCPACRAVFWTAAVLFDRGVTEEEVIIPTLVFARSAAGSEGYRDLAKAEGLVNGCAACGLAEIASGLSFLGEDQAYMGLELVEVVDGVPLVRVSPFVLLGEKHSGTEILKQVRIQILSKLVKPAAIRARYLRFLEEQGARWGKNDYGCLSYNFSRSYLDVGIEGWGESYTWGVEDSENPLHWPIYHFPSPSIVEGFCEGLLRSLSGGEWTGDVCGLDLYGKPAGKTAETTIPAFVAWHVGPAATGKIPAKGRAGVSRILNKHLLRPCSKPELPEGWSTKGTMLWRDVEVLRLRFERLHRAGSMRPLPPMVL